MGACEIDSALWDALLVAIKAFDGVNVMFAGLVVEGGIHLLNIESAVEMLGVATVAGSASLLAMLLMAGKAAQAFVDADRGAIVARIYFPRSDGRVALITERLPLVATHRNGTRMIEHCGERQVRDRDVVKFSSIEEGERRPGNLLLWTG